MKHLAIVALLQLLPAKNFSESKINIAAAALGRNTHSGPPVDRILLSKATTETSVTSSSGKSMGLAGESA